MTLKSRNRNSPFQSTSTQYNNISPSDSTFKMTSTSPIARKNTGDKGDENSMIEVEMTTGQKLRLGRNE